MCNSNHVLYLNDVNGKYFQILYDTMYITTQGGPGEATKVLAYHIYKMAFENSRFGYASAVAMVLLAIILVLTTIQFKCEKKFTGDM